MRRVLFTHKTFQEILKGIPSEDQGFFFNWYLKEMRDVVTNLIVEVAYENQWDNDLYNEDEALEQAMTDLREYFMHRYPAIPFFGGCPKSS